MDKEEYPEDSDSSDEDFDPGKLKNEVVSEVESDGDSEDPLSDKEDLGTRTSKRKKQGKKSRKKRKVEEPTAEVESGTSTENAELTEEEKKKRDDALWATFKKDTNFLAKPTTAVENSTDKETDKTVAETKQEQKPEKVKITQVFEFAGEEVKVEKEVPVNSKEAKLYSKPSGSNGSKSGGVARRGGLGSVLSQLGKKQKISTLEKSKLDWDRFKKEEDLEEELNTFNKGKDGYLERQDFLERTDLRRFEIEKEVRNIERAKRMNNVN